MKKTRKRQQASSGSMQTSFLPEPDFNPKWPRKNTLVYRALRLMLQGNEITPLDFEIETSSQRLPAYIDILCNKLDWPIQREDVVIMMENKPEVRQFRKYYLNKEFIDNLKVFIGGVQW